MIYTVYAKEDDMTFIMKDTDSTISVIGFYFGEPNEKYTKEYMGQLIAHVEKMEG